MMFKRPDNVPTVSSTSDAAPEELFLKFILIGDAGVGKTALLARYIHNKFHGSYNATIGVEFGSKTIEITENLKFRLQIWDTAGQESYTSVTKSFYRNSNCVFLVYDINDRETFEHLDSWIEEVIENGDPDSILILIGNKNDSESSRAVPYNEGVVFMKEHNMHFFFETSAQKGKNVELAFLEAAKLAYLSQQQAAAEGRETSLKTRDTISLTTPKGLLRPVNGKYAKAMSIDNDANVPENQKCNC